VQALAAIGDWKSARMIIDRFANIKPTQDGPQPFLLSEVYPGIADNIGRLVHVAIENVETPLRPLAGLKRKAETDIDNFSPPINSIDPVLFPEHVLTGRKLYPPRYKYFFDGWKDMITAYADFSKTLRYLKLVLRDIGPHLYRDVSLVGKLIRIGREHIKSTPGFSNTDEVGKSWLQIISNYFFPAISQMSPNPGILAELWSLVSLWPYTVRYTLYHEWLNVTYKRYPQLAAVEAVTTSTCISA
jgi:THO complex subunit 2 N-terminus